MLNQDSLAKLNGMRQNKSIYYVFWKSVWNNCFTILLSTVTHTAYNYQNFPFWMIEKYPANTKTFKLVWNWICPYSQVYHLQVGCTDGGGVGGFVPGDGGPAAFVHRVVGAFVHRVLEKWAGGDGVAS